MVKLTPDNAAPGVLFTNGDQTLSGILIGYATKDEKMPGMYWVDAVSRQELEGKPKTSGWMGRIHVSYTVATKWLIWEQE